ncbi:hypothetical protein MTR_4g044447 [Medicago truncatula]|uniref:Uncharacterized protein n=1 Tax=Medicago truncatula TaxID=3880 RepID=A0A072UKD5_MEDTR|nr:hypothetical protein MTR_4g044447 [Medicago truncatula]
MKQDVLSESNSGKTDFSPHNPNFNFSMPKFDPKTCLTISIHTLCRISCSGELIVAWWISGAISGIGLVESRNRVLHSRRSTKSPGLKISDGGGVADIIGDRWRSVVVQSFKGSHFSGGVLGGGVPIFSKVKVLEPCVGMVTCKTTEVLVFENLGIRVKSDYLMIF